MTPEQLIHQARVMAGKLSIASADPGRNVEMVQPIALAMTRLLLEMSDALALAATGPRHGQGPVPMVVGTGPGDPKVRMGRAMERAEIVRLLQQRADEASEAAHLSGRRQMLCANAAAAALETAAAEVMKRGEA